MKKLFILFLAATVLFGVAMSAQAAIITFDEPGISVGDLIDNEYASLGINWVFTPVNEVTRGDLFSRPFDIGSTNQILWYNADASPGGAIQLDFLSDYLSFDYRRPSSSATITVELLNSGVLVDDFVLNWPSDINNPDWDPFVYDGSSGDFNQILMSCSNKFVIDNLEIRDVNAVPIPPAFVLLASGLLMLIHRRRMI